MNSSQATTSFFDSSLRPIVLSHPTSAFLSKCDPFLCYNPFRSRKCPVVNLSLSRSRESCFIQMNRHLLLEKRKRFSINYSDKPRSDFLNNEETHTDASDTDIVPPESADAHEIRVSESYVVSKTLQDRPKSFRNRFLDFVRISSVLNNAAEKFFKSEIRRRLFVTAVLLVVSRIGYFIPLPGFDRRLIPQDYLSFVSGSVEELGEFGAEIKLSLFQLGLSPQIVASIIMQVLCHVLPSLVKLRKEGLDGHEKIKSYMCV